MEREGSTLEEGPGAGMLNRILGGKDWTIMKSTGKGNAGGKGSTWKERVSTLKEDLERACSAGFWKESAGQNGKYERKRKYMTVERDTSKTTMVDGEIGRRAKTHEMRDSWPPSP